MASSTEADSSHPGGEGGVDTGRAVFDDETAIWRRCELLRGVKKQIGSRLTPLDHCRAEEIFAKVMAEAGQLKFSPDLLHGAARRNTNGQSQRTERLGNSPDRRKRLTKFVFDHRSDTLGVRERQCASPLMLDDSEHVRIAHAAEASDEIPCGDRIAASGQHVGMGMVDDWLAIDEYSVAVKDDNSKYLAVI